MRVGIFSDIHGNLEALDTVLEFLTIAKPDLLVCLGDIVGYGADPNACTERCFEKADLLVLGNHDAAVLEPDGRFNMNQVAVAALDWTANALTAANLARLRQLPMREERDNLLFVHASPRSPEEWIYLMYDWDLQDQFPALSQDCCFVGHSHIPRIFAESGKKYVSDGSQILPADDRYIVNIGSVGQPRDRDARACVVIYDTETRELIFTRLVYNIQEAHRKIIAAGLPRVLATRLIEGR